MELCRLLEQTLMNSSPSPIRPNRSSMFAPENLYVLSFFFPILGFLLESLKLMDDDAEFRENNGVDELLTKTCTEDHILCGSFFHFAVTRCLGRCRQKCHDSWKDPFSTAKFVFELYNFMYLWPVDSVIKYCELYLPSVIP